ncbi:hypothetical protein [Burkholderia ubonensis]|uniref:hypothetical protein n=1 Tax=Burkholderia ubonensis TaxID=101571 RepID=UPI0012FA40F0|nr:hypothetical protein [Burkholderia ubonensis]
MGIIQYGDIIRLANGYAFESDVKKDWTGGYLGIGDSYPRLDHGIDRVGAYKSYDNHDLQTQWTIKKVATTGDGADVFSGDRVRLQNAVDQTYLALFNFDEASDVGYTVATTDDTDIISIASDWTIFIYSGASANNARLKDGAYIYLVSTFPKKDQGHLAATLDTNGVGSAYQFQFLVTGGRLINRDGGSGSWQVTSVS